MRALRHLIALSFITLLAAGCGGPKGEPFPVDAYLTAPANLQGNRYSLDAEIDSQLEWTEGVGRLIAVRPIGRDLRLPVFIADTHEANLMVAQRYRFELTVRKGGLLTVTALKKL
ncbi:MAG: hypothetical protein ABII82_16305 [Verrucomicrobiota bacterium]